MELQLALLINTHNCKLKVGEIKDLIYNENGQDCLNKIIASFDSGDDIDELNRALQVITSAWNYWPHKKLNGLSPAEKILEAQQK